MHPGKRMGHGFTYLWALALLAVMSIGLAAVGPLMTQSTQRDRERELLRVGVLYAKAIEQYYRVSPGGRAYPARLEQLLLDDRFPVTIRHLRTLYGDPLVPGQPLGLLRDPSGGIAGVFSNGAAKPVLQAPWTNGAQSIDRAEHYSDWHFMAKVDK